MNEDEYVMKNYGDRPYTLRLRRITPSQISIILHVTQKPNSIIVLLFIQNNSQFKNTAKTCLPPSIHQSIVRVQDLFSSANILQIGDVAPRVVFLLFLPCFQLLFCLVLTLEMSELSAIFVLTTKTTQPHPQVFLVNSALTCKKAALLMSSVH